MPQLNPSPWFMVFMYAWVIFLLIVVPMTLSFITPNEPTMQDAFISKTKPWAWPWH